jgi:hypothetical protein
VTGIARHVAGAGFAADCHVFFDDGACPIALGEFVWNFDLLFMVNLLKTKNPAFSAGWDPYHYAWANAGTE